MSESPLRWAAATSAPWPRRSVCVRSNELRVSSAAGAGNRRIDRYHTIAHPDFLWGVGIAVRRR
jgi:hypothetical protein